MKKIFIIAVFALGLSSCGTSMKLTTVGTTEVSDLQKDMVQEQRTWNQEMNDGASAMNASDSY